MRTFAFDFTTTPQVLLCLGRGGFVLLCDLLLLHLGRLLASSPPSCQLTQYLFQYMIKAGYGASRSPVPNGRCLRQRGSSQMHQTD
jgi:hypothetical protein